jgi:hypothetical protein
VFRRKVEKSKKKFKNDLKKVKIEPISAAKSRLSTCECGARTEAPRKPASGAKPRATRASIASGTPTHQPEGLTAAKKAAAKDERTNHRQAKRSPNPKERKAQKVTKPKQAHPNPQPTQRKPTSPNRAHRSTQTKKGKETTPKDKKRRETTPEAAQAKQQAHARKRKNDERTHHAPNQTRTHEKPPRQERQPARHYPNQKHNQQKQQQTEQQNRKQAKQPQRAEQNDENPKNQPKKRKKRENKQKKQNPTRRENLKNKNKKEKRKKNKKKERQKEGANSKKKNKGGAQRSLYTLVVFCEPQICVSIFFFFFLPEADHLPDDHQKPARVSRAYLRNGTHCIKPKYEERVFWFSLAFYPPSRKKRLFNIRLLFNKGAALARRVCWIAPLML